MEKTVDEKQDLTQGNLLWKLVSFSLPLVVTGLLQLFFTTADLFVVGQFGNGNNSLSAVGSCNTIINLVIGSTLGLSSGLNIIIGNAKGDGDGQKIKRTIQSAFIVAAIIGTLVAIIGYTTARNFLIWTQVDEVVIDQAEIYLKTYCLGAPFILVYNFAASTLRGYGDSKTSLFILSIAGVINIILNCIFVIVFDLEVFGVALATIISQFISCIAAVVYLSKGKNVFIKYDIAKPAFNKVEIFEILKFGVMAMCQSFLFNISNIIIQTEINAYGAAVTAGSTAASNLDGYIYFVMNSFSVGMMAVVSQNYGARKFDRCKKTLLYSCILVTVVAGLMGVLAIVFRKPLLSILITDKGDLDVDAVFNAASERLIVVSSLYFTCGIMECFCFFYRGLKYAVTPTIVSLTGSVIFRIAFIFTLYRLPEFHTLTWLLATYPISWILTIAIYVFIYPSYTRKSFNKNIPLRGEDYAKEAQ